MFGGTIHARDRLRFGRNNEGRVTAIGVFDRGGAIQSASVTAGQIGKLWGLADIRIGDTIGTSPATEERHFFAPPTLETLIVPQRQAERRALHAALAQLAEQDPLINLRRDDMHQELFVSLYGEVQKEVIQATLLNDFGIDVEFRETTTICVERPLGTGEACETLGKAPNPFLATLGLRIEPAPINTGVTFQMDVKVETVPLFVYKSVEEFQATIEETVRETLRQGLYGWQVTDCIVTLTQSGYVSPGSTAKDFRLLTPLVLMSALQQAGTVVCEPMHRFQLEIPADTFGRLLPIIAQLHGVPYTPVIDGSSCVLEGEIPVARVHELRQQLPGLTRGEGVLHSAFDRYKPVRGGVPSRQRTDNNPLNRKEYLLHVLRRV
jgi:ribosomal protection tetracycline resistance protein